MNITLLVVVLAIYFLGMVGIGLAGRKYATSFDSFVSAGRNAGVLLIIGSAVGSQIGNGFVVGGAGSAAVSGIGGAWYGIACGLGYLIIALLLNKIVYTKGFISLPEFLEDRYGDKLTSVVFSLATVLSYIGNIAAQIMAGSALFHSFGLNGTMGAVTITVVVLAYSSLSGLWGAYTTSVVQVGVIAVALLATTAVIIAEGGLSVIQAAIASGTVPADFWKLDAIGTKAILLTVIPVCLAALCDQQTVQRINAAKSARVSMTAHIWSAFLCIALSFMPALVGMYGASVYGVTDSSIFFVVAMDKLPALISAIAIAAVIAAIMSTIDSMMIGFSTILLKNIYKGLLNPGASEKTLKRGDTLISVVVAVVALALSLQFTSIIDLLSSTYTFLSACCLVPFVGGLFWKKGTARGAVVSSVAGLLLVSLSLSKILVLPLLDLTPVVISLIIYVAVSLLDKEGQKRNELLARQRAQIIR